MIKHEIRHDAPDFVKAAGDINHVKKCLKNIEDNCEFLKKRLSQDGHKLNQTDTQLSMDIQNLSNEVIKSMKEVFDMDDADSSVACY